MASRKWMQVREFGGQVKGHLIRVIRREERVGEAAPAVTQAARKLAHKLVAKPEPRGRHKAKKYVNEGKNAYNAANYDRAETWFQRAIEEDAGYAVAWLYLGNAFYKRHRLTEAVTAWQKAADSEPDTPAAERAESHIARVGKSADGAGVIAHLRGRIESRNPD